MSEKSINTQNVRIMHIPNCKMVSSGVGFFGDDSFKLFEKWFSGLNVYPSLYGYDFASDCCGTGMRWMYIYNEQMEVPDGLEIIDFVGGYYAVVTVIDGDGESYASAMAARDEYLRRYSLEIDNTRWQLGHILTGYDFVKEIFGSGQMDYWAPIKKMCKE